MKHLLCVILSVLSFGVATVTPADAALYTNSYGTLLTSGGNPSECDDCESAVVNFSGAGQSLNFFGSTYPGLYVVSNGYITFNGGISSTSPGPLNTQTNGPIIAPLGNDLYSGDGLPIQPSSNVYVNNSTPGQLIITWENMDDCCNDPHITSSTFQLVVRSDQFAIPTGEGQIGLFYGNINGQLTPDIGLGDGLAASNPGEQVVQNNITGALSTSFSNHAPIWYLMNAGGLPTPGTRAVTSYTAAIPTLSGWGMILLAGMLGMFGIGVARRQM